MTPNNSHRCSMAHSGPGGTPSQSSDMSQVLDVRDSVLQVLASDQPQPLFPLFFPHQQLHDLFPPQQICRPLCHRVLSLFLDMAEADLVLRLWFGSHFHSENSVFGPGSNARKFCFRKAAAAAATAS